MKHWRVVLDSEVDRSVRAAKYMDDLTPIELAYALTCQDEVVKGQERYIKELQRKLDSILKIAKN